MYTVHIEYQKHTWLLHMHSYMSDTLMRIILITCNIYIKSPWNPWSPPCSLRDAGHLPILLAKPSSNLVLLLKPPSFFSKSQISRDLPKLPSVREFYPNLFPFSSYLPIWFSKIPHVFVAKPSLAHLLRELPLLCQSLFEAIDLGVALQHHGLASKGSDPGSDGFKWTRNWR